MEAGALARAGVTGAVSALVHVLEIGRIRPPHSGSCELRVWSGSEPAADPVAQVVRLVSAGLTTVIFARWDGDPGPLLLLEAASTSLRHPWPERQPVVSVDVVFFHGAGTGAYDEDAELAGSLARHLGKDFSVDVPRLPEDDPEDRPWLHVIEEAIARASAPVVLVGHSVGGYLLLKYLTMQRVTTPVLAICIIAAPFPGADPAWTFDGFVLPGDLDRRLPADAKVLLYASEDDDTVPFTHRDLYAAAIPRAITRTTPGGHQLGNDLRVVAEDIRALW